MKHCIIQDGRGSILPNRVLELADEPGGSTVQKNARSSNALTRAIHRFKNRTQKS